MVNDADKCGGDEPIVKRPLGDGIQELANVLSWHRAMSFIPSIGSLKLGLIYSYYFSVTTITVFSILNMGTGLVSSYRFDTRTPHQPTIKFDEFSLD